MASQGDGGADDLLARLQSAAEACCAGRPEEPETSWVVEKAAGQELTDAIEAVMTDGLVGNRAVGPSLWAVLDALRRAHPLQLAPGVDQAKGSAAALGRSDERFLVQIWIQQTLHQGSLTDALGKLRGQPHVQGAFSRAALLRQPATARIMASSLLPLKGIDFACHRLVAEAKTVLKDQAKSPDCQASGPKPEAEGSDHLYVSSSGGAWQGGIVLAGPQGGSSCRKALPRGDTKQTSRPASQALSGAQRAPSDRPLEGHIALSLEVLPGEGGVALLLSPVIQGGGGRDTPPSQVAHPTDRKSPRWMAGLFRRRSQDGGVASQAPPQLATSHADPKAQPASMQPDSLFTVVLTVPSGSPGVCLRIEPSAEETDKGGRQLSESLEHFSTMEASGGNAEQASQAVHLARAALLADSLRDAAASVLDEAVSPASGALGGLRSGSPRVKALLLLIPQLLSHGLRRHPQRHGPFGLLQWGEETTAWVFLMAVEEGWGNHQHGAGLPLGCSKIQSALRGLHKDQASDERCLRLWLLHNLEQRRLYDNLCAISMLPKAALLAWYDRSALMLDADAIGPFLAMLAGLGAVGFDSEGQLDGVRDVLESGSRMDISDQEHNPLVQGVSYTQGAQEALRGVGDAVGVLFNKHRPPTDPRGHQDHRGGAQAWGEFEPAVLSAAENASQAPGQASKAKQKVVAIGDGPVASELFSLSSLGRPVGSLGALPLTGGTLEDLLSPPSSLPEVRMDRAGAGSGGQQMPHYLHLQGTRAWVVAACGCLSLPSLSGSGLSLSAGALRGEGPALSPVSKAEEDGPFLLGLQDSEDGDDDLQDIPDFLPDFLPTVQSSEGCYKDSGSTPADIGDLQNILCGGEGTIPVQEVAEASATKAPGGMSRTSTLSERQEADSDWLSMGRVADPSRAALWEQYALSVKSSLREHQASTQEEEEKSIESAALHELQVEDERDGHRGQPVPTSMPASVDIGEALGNQQAPLAVWQLLSHDAAVHSPATSSMSPAQSLLSSATEDGDFCRLLSQEILLPLVDNRTLPEPALEPEASSATSAAISPPGQATGELVTMVRALVSGVIERVVSAAEGEQQNRQDQKAKPRPAGSRIQVMLWVDDDQHRVALSLFLPREISPNLPDQQDISFTSEGSESLGSGSAQEDPPGWPQQLPVASNPQGGAARDFQGVGALPRPAPAFRQAAAPAAVKPGGGLLLGAALMEGYAGVDNHTLADMSQVLRDGDSFENQSGVFSRSDRDPLDPGSPPSSSLTHPGLAEQSGGTHVHWAPKWVSVLRAETREKAEGSHDFTVYVMQVVSRDSRQWTVEHRFRDFTKLSTALKYQGLALLLPPCWGDISRARSVTGKHKLAPEVVEARRLMLDRCLSEAVEGPPALCGAAPLLDFLAPPAGQLGQKGPSLAALGQGEGSTGQRQQHHHHHRWSPAPWISAQADKRQPEAEERHGGELAVPSSEASGGTYGSSIRLVLSPPESLGDAELMKRQSGNCAACRNQIPMPRGGLLSGLGLSMSSSSTGPRKCEYSGRLYCPKCFGNSTAILPARVLHEWDFKLYPVSSIAAEFLGSIYEQPMLCIGAVNPGLYARVPLLARVHEKRIRASKAVQLAISRSSQGAQNAQRLLKAAGVRRYLLEGPEFWAMRELIELSKGAFSDLPTWLDNVADRASSLALSSIVGRDTRS